MLNSVIGRFRAVAILEGVSYLILLLICMPLKYIFHYKNAVLHFGWIHGILFMAFMVLLLQVWIKYKWSFGKVVLAFVSSLLPFGTFIFDKKIKREMSV